MQPVSWNFLVAFSGKDRDLCPSCATRRMVEVSAHLVDEVLPRVQHRQWVLAMPKRVRWHLRHKPGVISGLLAIFLRAVETTIRQRSPGADDEAVFHPALELTQAKSAGKAKPDKDKSGKPKSDNPKQRKPKHGEPRSR